MSRAAQVLPLAGITVVALEQVIAAPFATRQLAELGARVIKIERPGVGDASRAYDTTVKGLSSHFVWVNRSKESLSLDAKHPEAKPILAKLLAKADVFIQNLAPGAAARLGLGAGKLGDLMCRNFHVDGLDCQPAVRPLGPFRRHLHAGCSAEGSVHGTSPG